MIARDAGTAAEAELWRSYSRYVELGEQEDLERCAAASEGLLGRPEAFFLPVFVNPARYSKMADVLSQQLADDTGPRGAYIKSMLHR